MIRRLRALVADAILEVEFERIGARLDEWSTTLAMRIHPGLKGPLATWSDLGFVSDEEGEGFATFVSETIRAVDEMPDFQALINRVHEKLEAVGAFKPPSVDWDPTILERQRPRDE